MKIPEKILWMRNGLHQEILRENLKSMIFISSDEQDEIAGSGDHKYLAKLLLDELIEFINEEKSNIRRFERLEYFYEYMKKGASQNSQAGRI